MLKRQLATSASSAGEVPASSLCTPDDEPAAKLNDSVHEMANQPRPLRPLDVFEPSAHKLELVRRNPVQGVAEPDAVSPTRQSLAG